MITVLCDFEMFILHLTLSKQNNSLLKDAHQPSSVHQRFDDWTGAGIDIDNGSIENISNWGNHHEYEINE